MTRVISPHAKFSIQLIESPVKRGTDQAGNVVEYTDSKPVIADFAQVGLHDWEQIAALEKFNFSGIAEGVNPLGTVSVYDSEAAAIQNGWTPEFHARVDKRLRHLAEMNPGSMLLVETPVKVSPWPSYDTQDVNTIFRLFQETGADPETVRVYEHENQARPEVIEVAQRRQDGHSWEDIFPGPVGAVDGPNVVPLRGTDAIGSKLNPNPTEVLEFEKTGPDTLQATRQEAPDADAPPAQTLPAAPIVSGVASDQAVAPAKTDKPKPVKKDVVVDA